MLGAVRRRSVADVEYQRCARRFFEGRFERLDKSVRQAADEADRVYEHNPSAVRQSQRAGGGVERCEELVLRKHARLGQRVHQR